MRYLARLLFTALLAGLASMPAAWAQTYTATADAATQAAYPWLDISTTGTQLPLADDGVSGNIALGFNFTYGSTTYTNVRITANGMLQFGATDSEYQNSALPLNGSGGEPNIDAVMLPLWDDLNTNGNGTLIRYRTQGTSPNRVFVVSWLAAPYYCSNSGATCDNGNNQTRTIFATFQVQIHEQGHFVYRYGAVDGSGGSHSSGPTVSDPLGATVGYELTNSDYVQYSFRTASVPNNTTILWQRPGAATTPGGFNAFDTGTASGSITGFIKTKVAGSAFNLAVVALNTAKTAVHTTFTGDVKVELLDASDNTGALNASTGCRSSWTSALSTSTLTFASGDAGRDNIAQTQANSWRDVRVRISYPATGTATVIGCSTDNFAIRPASFGSLSATDSDASTAGTTRNVSNTGSTGGVVHKAGQPFTVRATAVNSGGTATTQYTGTPTPQVTSCGSTYPCGSTLGTLTLALANAAGTGTVSDTNARYSEAGAFTLDLVDSSFAAVDAADGSTTAEREIRASTTITVGRFVPDHFDIVNLITPVLRTFNSSTCSTRSFTYLGQPFAYATRPQATVLARNAAGATTVNYPASRWTSALFGITQTYAPLVSATPGLDSSGAGSPVISAGSAGTATLDAPSIGSPTLTMVRSATTPVTPFNASISLTWSVADTNEAAVTGNGSIGTTTPLTYPSIGFDAGSEFRYGQLKLASAYGSELVNLAVVLETTYWNGTGFITNAADQCTTLPVGSVALSSFRGGLAACETATAAGTLSFSSGRSVLRMLAPGNGNAGSVDATLQLGAAITPGSVACTAVGPSTTPATAAALPWLQTKAPGGTSFDQNPSARFSFGQRRAPLIHSREVF